MMKFNYTAELACHHQLNRLAPTGISVANDPDDTQQEHALQLLIEHDIKLISQTNSTHMANFIINLYEVLRFKIYSALQDAGYTVKTTDYGFIVSWDHLIELCGDQTN